MMETVNIEDVFDNVLISVTRCLADLSVHRIREFQRQPSYDCRITLYTKGNFEAYIIWEMESELVQTIIRQMHGDGMPPLGEEMIYIKEYINIICGRVVSIINNITGNASRLSVPLLCSGHETQMPLCLEKQKEIFCYQSEHGAMQIKIYYTIH